MATQRERIKHIFKFLEWDELTDRQFELVESFEKQFGRKGGLSDAQFAVLEEIFKEASEKV